MATRRKGPLRTSRPTGARASAKTFAAPVKSFQSHGGRSFTVGRGAHWERYVGDPLWSDTFPILFQDEPAGKLFRSLSYGAVRGTPRWHASISELRGPHLSELPRGIGYDVAAFDTAEEALEAWAASADQILDFRARRQAVSTLPVQTVPSSVLAAGVAAAIGGGLSHLLQGMSKAVGRLGEHFGVRDARRAMEHWFGNEAVHTVSQQAARAYLMTPQGRKLLMAVTDNVAGAIRKVTGRVGYKDVGAAIVEALK